MSVVRSSYSDKLLVSLWVTHYFERFHSHYVSRYGFTVECKRLCFSRVVAELKGLNFWRRECRCLLHDTWVMYYLFQSMSNVKFALNLCGQHFDINVFVSMKIRSLDTYTTRPFLTTPSYRRIHGNNRSPGNTRTRTSRSVP